MPADSTFAAIAGVLGRALPAKRTITAIKSSAVAGVIALMAGLFLMAAIGMACAALWAAVAPSFGSAGASLAVAGALVLIALFLLVVAWRVQRSGRQPTPTVLSPDQSEAIVKALSEFVGENQAAALMAALLAGVAAEQAGRRR